MAQSFDTTTSSDIHNSNQGSQFTSDEYTLLLKSNTIQTSMDGKSRATDDIFVERLWRSLKQEYIYLNPEAGGLKLYQGVKKWFSFYNHKRHHQSLGHRLPADLYNGA
ncbi:integrase core domain-containing protein [Desertivirga xinjiangensis]|uniref:integrase core domain-containing protein n=1 Tax=Desertivirga xinjiangensis TaxID=539206 RepID=UPI0021099C73|nr:integrase core domain-containing protein [Pedobacter xinjiangensis]